MFITSPIFLYFNEFIIHPWMPREQVRIFNSFTVCVVYLWTNIWQKQAVKTLHLVEVPSLNLMNGYWELVESKVKPMSLNIVRDEVFLCLYQYMSVLAVVLWSVLSADGKATGVCGLWIMRMCSKQEASAGEGHFHLMAAGVVNAPLPKLISETAKGGTSTDGLSY